MRLRPEEALHLLDEHRATFAEQSHEATYLPLFQHGSLELEICRPHKVDLQQPHEKDELYIILSGEGYLEHQGKKTSARAGDLFFVPAGDDHRFVDFSGDFAAWVVFYGPSGGE